MASYERLSGFDHSFLMLETPSTCMHVAITAIFDGGSVIRKRGGIDIKRMRRYFASRLHLIPRYRQRLAYIPVVNDPVWVDDEGFDVDYHVRHTHLPHPGTDRQLQQLCARILERPLDRTRPLWEAWIIEGVAGRRFAMLNKVHHCMVDGIAGVELLAALLGLAPNEQVEKPSRWIPRPPPSRAELLRDDMWRRASVSLDVARRLPALMTHAAQTGAAVRERLAATWHMMGTGLRPPLTPFNQPIGAHRRVDWLTVPLSEVKAIKNRLGGTINDVVLATVAGGVRGFLQRRRLDVNHLDLRTIVPVSTRTTTERGVPGNRVAAWIVALPIREPSALKRYIAVRDTTTHSKQANEKVAAEMLTEAAEWSTAAILRLALRLINQVRPFDLVVTNVPGPQVPFYLLDAPMVAAYPHVPLFENQGLGIALFSYNGQLSWGFGADWDLVPDLHDFVAAMRRAFAELREVAGLETTVAESAPQVPHGHPRPHSVAAESLTVQ